MIKRALYTIVFSNEWGRQMRFITGPRQSGKTTIAKAKLAEEKASPLYYLWDLRSVKDRYRENELFFTADAMPGKSKKWICFDEIHKMPQWKNMLKGIYDTVSDSYNFIITGSAKLDIFRKKGDSLSGRFFKFRLFPLTLAEAVGRPKKAAHSPKQAVDLITRFIEANKPAKTETNLLLQYSGFPEPYARQSEKFMKIWTRDYIDTVVKEDIGLLTSIIALEKLVELYDLLPEMTGSPLSEASLGNHISVSPPMIKQYLKRLEDFYLIFRIRPWVKNIKRSLHKSAKAYLYNWAVIKNEPSRFENYIAVQLQSLLSLWNDAGEGPYELFYIRNREKQETDFLIVWESKPWLLIESKLSDQKIDRHHYKNQRELGNIPLLQVCREPGIRRMEAKNAYVLSAERFY